MAVAALALLAGAAPARGRTPAAELPTWKIGDRWHRSDGTWELTRIERDSYVFSADRGREIHFTKTLVMTKIVADGNIPMELDSPHMPWPLRVGKFGSPIVNVIRQPYPTSNVVSKHTWSVEAFEDVKVPAGTFGAFRISTSIGWNLGFMQWVLWYSPDLKQYVKGEGRLPSQTFELANVDRPAAPATTARAPVAPERSVGGHGSVSGPVELPTYKVGDTWPRSDGMWTLTRIEGGNYVFTAGPGQEIHLSRTLAVVKVVVAGTVQLELDAADMQWPLRVGKFASTFLVVRRGPPGNWKFSDIKHPWLWNVVALEEVTVPAGTFKAFRIANDVARGFTNWTLWYAPEVGLYVKGESPVPGLAFELAPSSPPAVATAVPPPPAPRPATTRPAERPTYQIGEKWIRSDGTYELKRIDKDVYVFQADRGNEIRLTRHLELTTVIRDGRVEFDLDPGLRVRWPLEERQIPQYPAVWRGASLRNPWGSAGDVKMSARVLAESSVTVPAGTFRTFRMVYSGMGGPTFAAIYNDFISLWYAPEVQRFVKGESSRIAALNFELTGVDDRAPPVVASTPRPAPEPSAPKSPSRPPTAAAPVPAPAVTAPPPVTPTPSPPPAPSAPPAPAPPLGVALELEGPPGAEVRIGQARHTLDAQGRVTLTLPPGQHQLDATKDGYVPARQTVTLAPGQTRVTQRLAMAQVVPPAIAILDPKPGTPVRTPDARLRVEVRSAYRLGALRIGKEGEATQLTFTPTPGAKPGDPWVVETPVGLAEGDNRIRLEAVDEHGGRTEQRVTLVRQSQVASPPAPPMPAAPPAPPPDNEPPRIALNYPPENAKVDREQITVLGLVTDNVAVDRVLVSVNGRMVAMGGESAVSARSHSVRTPVALQPGDNVLEITAVDKAGNAAQVVRMVTRAAPVVVAPPPPPQPRHEQWAVVIGIGTYESTVIPRLRYSVSDADAVYRTLTGPAGFKKENVLLLTDRSERKPTLKNIKWALGTFLARAARKDDTVLIFFAGHGAPEADARGLERDGLAKYLIPQDADPDDLFSTALPMDDLHTIFGRIESERVVAFLDACYSGAAGGRTFMSKRTRAGAVDDLFLERLTRSRGRAIVTASRPAEVSIELPDLGHGIFTYYLVEGLKGAADLNRDGIVTLQELYEYLEQQVTRKARSVGGNQHPVMKGEMEGVLPLTKVRQP